MRYFLFKVKGDLITSLIIETKIKMIKGHVIRVY